MTRTRLRLTLFLAALAATIALATAAFQARQLQHQEFRVAVAMAGPVRVLNEHRELDQSLQQWFAESEALRSQASGLYRLLAVLTSIAGAGMLASLLVPKNGDPA